MSEEEKEPPPPPPPPPGDPVSDASSKPNLPHPDKHVRVGPLEVEDPGIAEKDPEDRFHRYDEEIGRGKFKMVYRGYDTENGIDVAWCKVLDPDESAAPNTLQSIYAEMKKGLSLDHSSIVHCFACWLDGEQGCINLITELFTSGTLRSYREMYSNVDLNVHRRFVRQILNGLVYLHARTPPVVHADLRLDKIYVNGFNGEVKIGDLGLATLLQRRYKQDPKPEFDSPLEDLYALGLCVYELLTGTQVDQSFRPRSLREVSRFPNVKDVAADDFISQCLRKEPHLTATELLEHPFLQSQSTHFKAKNGSDKDVARVDSEGRTIGTKLKGEDVSFEFHVSYLTFDHFFEVVSKGMQIE